MLLEPIEKEINGKTFILSKFPAVAGREIIAIYTDSVLNKNNDYALSESIMFKLMCYVAVPTEGKAPLQLTTRALVDNHTKDWNTLIKIEDEMIKYNSFFLKDEPVSNSHVGVTPKTKI